MLRFTKIDEVYFIVTPVTPDAYVDVQEWYYAFALDHPEKQFMKAYKDGMWDGKVKFIKWVDKFKESAFAPIGLFYEIYNYMKDSNIEFEIVDDDIGIMDLDLSDFEGWLIEFEKDQVKKISNR